MLHKFYQFLFILAAKVRNLCKKRQNCQSLSVTVPLLHWQCLQPLGNGYNCCYKTMTRSWIKIVQKKCAFTQTYYSFNNHYIIQFSKPIAAWKNIQIPRNHRDDVFQIIHTHFYQQMHHLHAWWVFHKATRSSSKIKPLPKQCA